MSDTIKRCKVCKTVLDEHGGCARCSFIPQRGRLPAGYNVLKRKMDLTRDPALEDDYSDESGPDSTCRQQSECDPRTNRS